MSNPDLSQAASLPHMEKHLRLRQPLRGRLRAHLQAWRRSAPGHAHPADPQTHGHHLEERQPRPQVTQLAQAEPNNYHPFIHLHSPLLGWLSTTASRQAAKPASSR